MAQSKRYTGSRSVYTTVNVYGSMDVDDYMIDKYCRACGKRISLAEDDLYAGHCNICVRLKW